MFEIGWNELLLIAIVAIVVIGPKDLPRVMRVVGQWSGRMKRMAREFQNQFNEALREAELEDVKKSVAEIGQAVDVSGEIAATDAAVRNQMTATDAALRQAAEPPPAPPAEPPKPVEGATP